MDSPEALIITFVPSLVATLLHAERDKGSPLKESEVLAIRDAAPCIAVPRSIVPALAEGRGYDDLDPENVWEAWQVVRRSFASDATGGQVESKPG